MQPLNTLQRLASDLNNAINASGAGECFGQYYVVSSGVAGVGAHYMVLDRNVTYTAASFLDIAYKGNATGCAAFIAGVRCVVERWIVRVDEGGREREYVHHDWEMGHMAVID